MFVWTKPWQELWKRNPKSLLYAFSPAPNGHHAGRLGFYGDFSIWRQKLDGC